MKNKFTHFDDKGNVRMVDVGNKPTVNRIAVARGKIKLQTTTIKLIKSNKIVKGDCLTVAKIAGIQAVKRTGELIPLCHTLNVDYINVKFNIKQREIDIESEVHSTGKTGVEMEALTAVTVTALTIYDMCKAVDKTMIISDISLVKKQKIDLGCDEKRVTDA